MQRDDVYLLDRLEAAKLALEYASSKTKEEFLKDTQCQDAVIRRLELIGEAAGRVSTEMRDKHSKIPWSAMIGMRNVMINDYGDIDLTIVWETAQKNLPELITDIRKIIGDY